ncbi:AMP-binding protein [Streptomyces sp. MS1.AVA.1]|uniref:AMP-binding protein n=1 Tax=Streptomyces machairae TaxID=3134109 RepID=A0ABU8UUB4_9ACTN
MRRDRRPRAAGPGAVVPAALELTATAYIQYTSGSTSEPRGVVISHRNLLHNLLSIREKLIPAEVLDELRHDPSPTGAGWLPHYHDMGLVGMLLSPLVSYGNLVFSSPVSFIAHPLLWLQMISRYRAYFTFAPNFGYDWLLRSIKDSQLADLDDDLDLDCLRFALNGAEPVRADVLNAFARRLAPIGFGPRIWAPSYGLAEATLMVTGTPCGSGPTVGASTGTRWRRATPCPTRTASLSSAAALPRAPTSASSTLPPRDRSRTGRWARCGYVVRASPRATSTTRTPP